MPINSSRIESDIVPVCQAVLPIAVRGPEASSDLARADLLLQSIDFFWEGSTPFIVWVIDREQDRSAVRAALKGSSRVQLQHVCESEFYASHSSFFGLPGWWKQQLLKLKVPAVIGLGSYLTLDADILCCRTFSEATFIQQGRLISHWEYKDTQSWWRNLATNINVPFDPRSYGLSVTPNTLHSELSKQALLAVCTDEEQLLATLHAWIQNSRSTGSPWTEYSLYTYAAEIKGNLFDYHLKPDLAFASDVRIHSHSNVWSPDQITNLQRKTGTGDPGHFIVVQSTANVPLERVRQLLSQVVNACPDEG